MNKNILIWGIAGLLFATPALAQQKPATTKAAAKTTPAAAIPADPTVKIGKLPNGLVYYIKKNYV